MVAALGFGSIALYLTDRGRNLSLRSVLSGLAIGLAFEIHGNAVIYGPAVGLLYLLDYGPGTFRTPRFWGFAAGVAGGLAFYALLHIVPNPQAGVNAIAGPVLARDPGGYVKTPPILTMDPVTLARSVADTAGRILASARLPAPTGHRGSLAARIQTLAIRHTPPGGNFALILGFVLVIYYKPTFYAVLLSPAVDISVAVLLASLFGSWRKHNQEHLIRAALTAGVVIAAALVILNATYTLAALRQTPMSDYQKVVASLPGSGSGRWARHGSWETRRSGSSSPISSRHGITWCYTRAT